jgi:hypothetical protein
MKVEYPLRNSKKEQKEWKEQQGIPRCKSTPKEEIPRVRLPKTRDKKGAGKGHKKPRKEIVF